MKKILLISVIFLSFFLFSCGNDVTNGGNDSDEAETADTADEEATDEVTDEATDETTDEVQDEITDEISDEITDEVTDEVQDEITDEITDEESDDDNIGCTDISVTYDTSGLETVAEDISLEVYSNGWGNLLETLTMETEGSKKIEVDEEYPYEGDTPSYFIYETAEGFFTEYTYAVYGDTISVDLDPIMPDYVNGVIFMVQSYFGPTVLANTEIRVTDTSGDTVGCFMTNGSGKFVIDIPDGNYFFNFTDMDFSVYSEPVKVDSNYIELRILAEAQVDKPNIYLYPEETTELDVTVRFPMGGHVTTSIPEYGDGWHVTVDPDGTIDGEYGYLFYESQNPDVFQYVKGWTVKSENLETFFKNNMKLYGFKGQEIEDFIEWWIPRLDASCYDIFPQTAKEIDPVITLDISVEPDSIQRLYYAIKKYEKCNEHLKKPVIEPFERKGFSVLEWGVTLR